MGPRWALRILPLAGRQMPLAGASFVVAAGNECCWSLGAGSIQGLEDAAFQPEAAWSIVWKIRSPFQHRKRNISNWGLRLNALHPAARVPCTGHLSRQSFFPGTLKLKVEPISGWDGLPKIRTPASRALISQPRLQWRRRAPASTVMSHRS